MRTLGAVLLCCLAAAPAAAASISVTVLGSTFKGGPVFLLEADTYPVGAGIVREADTDYLFTYTVDDAVLAAAEQLNIRLVNDSFEEGVGDRNLRVVSLSVNGTVFRGDALTTFGPEGLSQWPGDVPSAFYQLSLSRPATGWPQR